jgi:hypothetical protein
MVVLAARSGLPIVPVGIGFSRAWRAKSWDRFAVPKPFSHCVYVADAAVHVPPDVGRDGVEHYRQLVEQRMLDATAAAEHLARGGPHRSRRGAATPATAPPGPGSGRGRDEVG